MTTKVTASTKGSAAGRDVVSSSATNNGTVGIIGDGATGNVVIHTLNIQQRTAFKSPQPTIPEGSITEEQAARLKDLVAEWVVTHNQIKPRNPLTHQAAWLKLNRRIRVATYRATPAGKFSSQEKWLLQQAAILRNMASAPARDDSWRIDKIRAIKARATKTLGDANIYKAYIKKNFGAESLTDLANDDLQQTYGYVFNKKAAAK